MASALSHGESANRASRRRGWGRKRDDAPAAKAVPLRVWLVVIAVTISGLGLFGSSVAVSQIMSDVVRQQTDQKLEQSTKAFIAAGYSSLGLSDGDELYASSHDDWVGVLLPTGAITEFTPFAVDRPALDQVPMEGIVTVPSEGGTPGAPIWRVQTTAMQNGSVVIMATTTRAGEELLAKLTTVQMAISFIIMVVLALCSYYLVYRALKPIRQVEDTATCIAAGDFDRRVPQWPMNTEVGRLAYALNVMLERLQSAIDDAREKEDQMRRFVGDASHELRTPLTSLRGYTELYRAGATDDIDRVLGKVDAESKRMSLLVEDLLALTRAEGQRMAKDPVDVLGLATSVAGSARAAFPGRVIDVANHCDEVPVVRGDKARLHQVFLNLVTNAVRHGGEEAEVTIRVSFGPLRAAAASDAGPGASDAAGAADRADAVVVEVIDNGVGMSPEVTGHIFERFYRADTSRSRASGGSGLGLAITRSLVGKHGGTVTVDSIEGAGSTFTVRLPRLGGEASPA